MQEPIGVHENDLVNMNGLHLSTRTDFDHQIGEEWVVVAITQLWCIKLGGISRGRGRRGSHLDCQEAGCQGPQKDK